MDKHNHAMTASGKANLVKVKVDRISYFDWTEVPKLLDFGLNGKVILEN